MIVEILKTIVLVISIIIEIAGAYNMAHNKKVDTLDIIVFLFFLIVITLCILI